MKDRKTIAEEIQDLRIWFDEEYLDDPSLCDKSDYQKVMKDDWTVKRFILTNENGPVKGLECLKQCLTWRKANQVNNFQADQIPREVYNLSPVFQYLPDYKGNNTLYIRGNLLMNLVELDPVIRKLLIHSIESIDSKSDRVASWALIVDVSGSDYSQINSSWLMEAHEIISTYYPLGLRYTLIFGASRMLRLFGRIVNYFGNLHFVDSKTITDFIPTLYLPDFMGGESAKNYRKIPANSKSLKELAPSLGLSEDDVKSIEKNLEPHLVDEKLTEIVEIF